MASTYRVRLRERDYVLWPAQTPETLAVHLVAVDSLEYWSNTFDGGYVDEVTSKAGSRRDLATFACMLQTALEGRTSTVSLDVLTAADLQRLQAGGAPGGPEQPLAPPSRLFLILSFRTEFDRCHYPLPLDAQGPRSPVHAFRVGVSAVLRDADRRAGLAERAAADAAAQLARAREALAEARAETQRAQRLAADAERRAREAEEGNGRLQTTLRRVLARVEGERAERARRELVGERVQQRATEAAIQRAAEELAAGGRARARRTKRVKRVRPRGARSESTRDSAASSRRESPSAERSASLGAGEPGRPLRRRQETPVRSDSPGTAARSRTSTSRGSSRSRSSTPPSLRQASPQRELTPTARASPSCPRRPSRPRSLQPQPFDIGPEMEQIDRRLDELKGIIQTAMRT